MGSISPVSRPSQNDQNTPTRRTSIGSDTCYFCRRKGHWAMNCPEKSNTKSQPSPPSGGAMMNSPDILDMQCPCGAGTCRVWTSKTDKNPGRKFYRCPNLGAGDCKYFEWCDRVASNRKPNVVVETPCNPNVVVQLETPSPMCRCGAGKCAMDSGRKFFICPVKKGQGACSFKQPCDLPEKGREGDEITRELKFENLLNLSPHSEERTFMPLGPSASEGKILEGEASRAHVGEQSYSVEEILGREASDDFFGGQSESEVSYPTLSEYSEQIERPSQGDSPRRVASGGHASVQSGSEGRDSLAGLGVSHQVEGDEDYMSNILLSTARHFANEFLKHINGLSILCFLRQRDQLVEAVRVITNLGVDCSAFVSQIDDLILLIDDFQTLSTLVKQETAVQELKDRLNVINSEDNCRQARLRAIKGRLRIMDQALVAERQVLLAEVDFLEEMAVESQEERGGLQEEIERAEQEVVEIFAALQTGCHNQEQVLEKLRISLGSLQLWE